ncbi:Rz-like spanin [Shigella phage SFPH2]|uniref:Endopeptidase n=1 Tax=Shigella phage SFPH2 TaxID=2269380 RepID=A0A345AV94_9CAUD|nr:Rz-like spanin [Shigella phage SFPH2]AXF40827.1 endopeptidase [Shigella phage SFPH2]
MLELLRKALPWLVAGLLFCSGYWVADTKWEAKVNDEYITKLQAEDRTRTSVQREVSRIAKEYQDKMSELEGSTDRIIADLNRDNKRLRIRVQPTSGTVQSDGRCLVDGYADLDERDAKRLIAIGLKGDEWIKALQGTIRALQQEKEVKP